MGGLRRDASQADARLQHVVTEAGRTEALADLQREIVHCKDCPRLVAHCQQVASSKRRAYRQWDYWGRPVPSLGDPQARLLLIGLAPGAHGANRTGRMFTGDSSGDFLYDALHETGFASQAASYSRNDGLHLRDCYITAAVRCAPPGNRPTRDEFVHCRGYLERELQLLPRVRAIIALGQLALDAYLDVLRDRGRSLRKKDWPFAHGASYRAPGESATLLCSYHPSQQNTRTGRLTKPMLVDVLEHAKTVLTVGQPPICERVPEKI